MCVKLLVRVEREAKSTRTKVDLSYLFCYSHQALGVVDESYTIETYFNITYR